MTPGLDRFTEPRRCEDCRHHQEVMTISDAFFGDVWARSYCRFKEAKVRSDEAQTCLHFLEKLFTRRR